MPSAIRVFLFAALAVLAGAGGAATVHAHELRPALFTLTLPEPGKFRIAAQVNLEAELAGIGPQHSDSNDAPEAALYNSLRALGPEELEAKFRSGARVWLDSFELLFDGQRVVPEITFVGIAPPGDVSLARISLVRMAGEVPQGAKSVVLRLPPGFGDSVFQLRREDGDTRMSWVNDGAESEPLFLAGPPPPKGVLELIADYAAIGFAHILPKGPDHILFVLGLYLLSTRWQPLLVQVTAFTVAHSITLALGVYGVFRLPSGVVEPLIALSIAYVAFENMATSKLSPWRPFVVFGFGLLHGLGFAGVLEEIGLPQGHFLPALAGFNIGVELGQLAVIAIAWLAVGLWFGARPWYRTRVVLPCSAVIAAIALYWTAERILAA
ncbi:MAG: HupE/UreJ family protein [Hyphomicrobiales bacterium]